MSKSRQEGRGRTEYRTGEDARAYTSDARAYTDARADNADCLRVVLVTVRNPLNIGTAARAMSNFGFSRLRVVNPYEAAFREARSAVGASELLANAEEYKTVAEAVADCTLVVGTTAVRHRELQHPLK